VMRNERGTVALCDARRARVEVVTATGLRVVVPFDVWVRAGEPHLKQGETVELTFGDWGVVGMRVG
jgi:hypothetical protein